LLRFTAQIQTLAVAAALELCGIAALLKDLLLTGGVALISIHTVAAADVGRARCAQKSVRIANLTARAAVVLGLIDRPADGVDAALHQRAGAACVAQLTLRRRRRGALQPTLAAVEAAGADADADADECREGDGAEPGAREQINAG